MAHTQPKTYEDLKREAFKASETHTPMATQSQPKTEEDYRERNRRYQREYRERQKLKEQVIDNETSKPYLVKSDTELEDLYERKEELEIELDVVVSTIRWKEYKNRVPKED